MAQDRRRSFSVREPLRMTRQERDEILAQVAALQERLAEPVCWNCEHFDEGRCRQWGQSVPENAQASGCERWEAEISF